MTTLADLTRQTARLVTRMATGAATSLGTTTTLIDTVGLAGYPDDQFNGGTLWLTSGANAGKTRAITDFVDSTDTLTCAAFPSAIASGVTWEAASADVVTYQDLRQAVNLALREIGKIRYFDESLTSVDSQLAYDLPVGVRDVRAVEIVTDATTQPDVNTHYDERDDQIVFEQNREPVGGLTIRLIYRKFHAELTADTDALDLEVDEEYLVYLAARQAMRLAYKRFGKAGNETIPEWINEAIEEAKKHVKRNIGSPDIRVRTA